MRGCGMMKCMWAVFLQIIKSSSLNTCELPQYQGTLLFICQVSSLLLYDALIFLLCCPLPVVYSHSSHLWARGLCRAVGVPAASSASSTRGAGSRASRTSSESSTLSHLLSYQRLRRRPEKGKHNECSGNCSTRD